jgi:hypothetical protein
MADTDPKHQQLLGHLLGSLDDDEQEWVDSRLEHDAEYRREYAALRRRLAPLLAARPDFEPPEGLAERTCRLVASLAAIPRKRDALLRRRMSPESAYPGRAARFSWLDAAVLIVVTTIAGILLPPALHNSRSQARVALCQDGLRQLGLAMSQYGYHHGDDLTQYADNERLTTAGQFVADILGARLAPDDGRQICPDAWLAVQGGLHWSPTLGSWLAGAGSADDGREPDVSLALVSWSGLLNATGINWCAAGRESDPTNDEAEPTTAAVPLLADAPFGDTPSQIALDCHDGQGRNRFFGDGHVDFYPCSASSNAGEPDFSRDDSMSRFLVPVSFTGLH